MLDQAQMETLAVKSREVVSWLCQLDIAELMLLENPRCERAEARWRDAQHAAGNARTEFWSWCMAELASRGIRMTFDDPSLAGGPAQGSPLEDAGALLLGASTRQRYIEESLWEAIERQERSAINLHALALVNALAEYRAAIRALLATPVPQPVR